MSIAPADSLLALLDRPLPPPNSPSADELGQDNRLSQAQSLAAQDQLLPAAEAARRIWQADRYDVRAIGYLVCGAFLLEGLTALPRIGRCLCRCLDENWPQLQPVGQRGKHLGGVLRWFFMTLHNQLAFAKFEDSELWRQCKSSGELVAESIAALQILGERAAGRPEVPSFAGQLDKVRALLLPYAAVAAPSATPPLFAAHAAASVGEPLAVAAALPLATAPPLPTAGTPLSPLAFEPLARLLPTAIELLTRRELLRASVVCAEVERILDELPPERLLPQATSRFWAALSAQAEALPALLTWAGSEDRRAGLWRRLYGWSPTRFADGQASSPSPDGAAPQATPLALLATNLENAALLLSRGELERAAILLFDLLPRLERFDAREYLSAQLFDYYRAQADCAAELAVAVEALPALKALALRRLCRFDLPALLQARV